MYSLRPPLLISNTYNVYFSGSDVIKILPDDKAQFMFSGTLKYGGTALSKNNCLRMILLRPKRPRKDMSTISSTMINISSGALVLATSKLIQILFFPISFAYKSTNSHVYIEAFLDSWLYVKIIFRSSSLHIPPSQHSAVTLTAPLHCTRFAVGQETKLKIVSANVVIVFRLLPKQRPCVSLVSNVARRRPFLLLTARARRS